MRFILYFAVFFLSQRRDKILPFVSVILIRKAPSMKPSWSCLKKPKMFPLAIWIAVSYLQLILRFWAPWYTGYDDLNILFIYLEKNDLIMSIRACYVSLTFLSSGRYFTLNFLFIRWRIKLFFFHSMRNETLFIRWKFNFEISCRKFNSV